MRYDQIPVVSTHSRPKAAAHSKTNLYPIFEVSTHSRPKAAEYIGAYTNKFAQFQHTAARRRLSIGKLSNRRTFRVSTHSRPKAAVKSSCPILMPSMFQHTAARRRLRRSVSKHLKHPKFQHTAARRRLFSYGSIVSTPIAVSTHSRPKAAVLRRHRLLFGCTFQHTAARRRLLSNGGSGNSNDSFQHTAARRRLDPPTALFTRSLRFNTQPPEGGCRMVSNGYGY